MASGMARNALAQRFRPLLWLALIYLGIGVVTRIVLLAMTGSGVPLNPLYWLYAFVVGAGYDLITLLYIAWPLLLVLWLVPTRAYRSRPMAAIMLLLGLAIAYGLLFVAASELTFWNEFGDRFNFIAVDYLVYTREVVGNIEESYPVTLWTSLIGLAALVLVWFTRRGLRPSDPGSRFGQRTLVVLGWLALTVLSAFAVNGEMKDQLHNRYVDALAGNGIYQFFAAFRNSRLSYPKFYAMLPRSEAKRRVHRLLATPDATFVDDDPAHLVRAIRNPGPEQHLNVVLISVESLSADFLGAFGSSHGDITPHLDQLAKQSLFFTHLYANGTRTVRGLEALTLSVPPTPGDSLVKQPHNQGLFSLGDVFNQRGYASRFVYGGYGYFDSMNEFFNHNGYQAIDRRDIPEGAKIHSENVWGVADEDLYTLALKQMDAIHAHGKPFFLHIMTTSNHRPFTFPADRVKEANGTREGAVAYTDWSIADFIRRARQRSYFNDTVFVITADHCASSAGKTRIPLDRYHIPLLIYAPAHFAPRTITRRMSQIDIGPTLLGLLHFSYRSRFFGRDIFKVADGNTWAFPSNYQRLGFYRGDRLTILSPRREIDQVHPDPLSGDSTPVKQVDRNDVDDAIAFYQVAARRFRDGAMRWHQSDAMPVHPAQAASSAGP